MISKNGLDIKKRLERIERFVGGGEVRTYHVAWEETPPCTLIDACPETPKTPSANGVRFCWCEEACPGFQLGVN